MVGGLILAMLDNDMFDFSFVADSRIFNAVAAVGLGMLGGIALIFYGGFRFTNSKAFKRVALQDTFERNAGYTASFRKESMVGKTGVAYTVLRPSGKVMIDNEIYDAYTRGNYIESGTEIVVTEETGTSLKVKEAQSSTIE